MNNSVSKSSRGPIFDKARRAVTTLAGMTVPVIIKLQMAFAEEFKTTGQSWLKIVFQVLGGIGVIGGLIMGVMSILAFAEAKSEGGGPEMAKAKNGIIGAIILLGVGIAIYAAAGGLSEKVADLISFDT